MILVFDCIHCDELQLSLTDEQYAKCKNHSSLEQVYTAALADAGIELLEYAVGTMWHFPTGHRLRLVSEKWRAEKAR